MRIGILTGGGDVPGLNACIKAATTRAVGDGHEMVGSAAAGRGCSSSILRTRPPHRRTRWRSTPTWSARSTEPADDPPHVAHEPGEGPATDEPDFLKAGRVDDEARDHTSHVMTVLDHLGIDATHPDRRRRHASFALRLHDEGVPVVAVPKTMDNDVHGTDYCIGFSTAVTRTRSSSTSSARAPGRTNGSRSRYSAGTAGRPRWCRPTCPGWTARSSARCRSTSRSSRSLDGRQTQEPVAVRDDDDLRGRALRRGRDGDGRDGGRVRPPEARRIGAQTGEALKEHHR